MTTGQMADAARLAKNCVENPVVKALLPESERELVLSVEVEPGRYSIRWAAYLLGLSAEEVGILISEQKIQRVLDKMDSDGRKACLSLDDRLQVIGQPCQQAAKYILPCELDRRAKDELWLDRAMRTIRAYHRIRKGQL